MDLPLTNDLIHTHQHQQNHSRCRPCLLCFCIATTLLASLLLFDLVAKDQQGSKSELILLQEELFPEDDPQKAVVPEYTALFGVESVEVWEEQQPDGAIEDLETGNEVESEDEARGVIEQEAESEDRTDLEDESEGSARLQPVGFSVSEDLEDESEDSADLQAVGFSVSEDDADLETDESVAPEGNVELQDEGVAELEEGRSLWSVGLVPSESDVAQETATSAASRNLQDDGVTGSEDSASLWTAAFALSEDDAVEETEESVISGDSPSFQNEEDAIDWWTTPGTGSEVDSGFENGAPGDGLIVEVEEIAAKESSGLKTGEFAVIEDVGEEEEDDASGGEREPCYNIARKVSEPYTQEYVPQVGPVSISGPAWADYNWPDAITEEDMNYALSTGIYKSFKIIDKKLYASVLDQSVESELDSKKLRAFITAVLLALNLFDIPDVDFILDLGDHQSMSSSPALMFAFDNSIDNPKGFTVPDMEAIQGALGPSQLKTLFECLDWNYPVEDRAMTAVVHGAHTSEYGQSLIQESMSRSETSDYTVCALGDCGLTSSLPEESDLEISVSGDSAATLEDLNRSAFVVDIDGNSPNSEFTRLLKQNTPILKQDTQFPGYFWSHVIEDRPLQLFRRDGSDFFDSFETAAKLRDIKLAVYHRAVVEKMREFSNSHLSHYGVARATAYALTVYASKIEWTPGHEAGYVEIPSETLRMDTLPEGFKLLNTNLIV